MGLQFPGSESETRMETWRKERGKGLGVGGSRGLAIGVGAAQAEHGKWYLGVTDREVDKIA